MVLPNLLPRMLRRRKHQFLLVAVAYVLCSIGVMHHDFPFGMFQVSSARGTQTLDAPYYATSSSAAPNLVTRIIRSIASISKKQRIKWERDQLLQSDKNWEENPIFVMNLPGSATQTAFRYFKCAFGDAKDVAMYWAKTDELTMELQGLTKRNTHQEIGRCIQTNLQEGNPPLDGCGKARVWSSMGYSSPFDQQCFYPSMDKNALEELARNYPQATILQVLQDPNQWYESSYPRFRQHLATLCTTQIDADVPIPKDEAYRQKWIEFHQWHEASIRDFALSHPTLQYVEVKMNDTQAGNTLKQALGLPPLCWNPPKRTVNRLEKPKRQQDVSLPDKDIKSTKPQERELELVKTPQKQLTYPIFVASLPKSGTTSTQRFFQCGLGYYGAGHHWGYNETTEQSFKLGTCIESNIQANRSIFEDCGDYQVWTDIGYLDDKTKSNKWKDLKCFFPTMHGGLEAFYQSHPDGTIVNVLRDPEEWYSSAIEWRKLPERMSRTCKGFPPPHSSAAVWSEFYRWHTQHVRDFAAAHPSLTYLELSLEAHDTGKILEEHTGIPQVCWGDCNPDRRKDQCQVFKKKRDYELEESKKRQAGSSAWKKKKAGAVVPSRTIVADDPKWAAIQEKFNQYHGNPVKTVNGKIAALKR